MLLEGGAIPDKEDRGIETNSSEVVKFIQGGFSLPIFSTKKEINLEAFIGGVFHGSVALVSCIFPFSFEKKG